MAPERGGSVQLSVVVPAYNEERRIAPSLERMFKGDMRVQGRKLMAMVSAAVSSLTRLDSIVPVVQALGRRHAGYGVEERHYAVVEEALVRDGIP